VLVATNEGRAGIVSLPVVLPPGVNPPTRDSQIIAALKVRFGPAFSQLDTSAFTGSGVHSLLEPLYPPLPVAAPEEITKSDKKNERVVFGPTFFSLDVVGASPPSSRRRKITSKTNTKANTKSNGPTNGNGNGNSSAKAAKIRSARRQAETASESEAHDDNDNDADGDGDGDSDCGTPVSQEGEDSEDAGSRGSAAITPSPVVVRCAKRTGKSGVKNDDEFFRPSDRKGFIICKICGSEHWPPNRQKHIVKCLRLGT